jgi:hypothetical protein
MEKGGIGLFFLRFVSYDFTSIHLICSVDYVHEFSSEMRKHYTDLIPFYNINKRNPIFIWWGLSLIDIKLPRNDLHEQRGNIDYLMMELKGLEEEYVK